MAAGRASYARRRRSSPPFCERPLRAPRAAAGVQAGALAGARRHQTSLYRLGESCMLSAPGWRARSSAND